MRRRHGFTITEMLVAMALIMFIMAILSEAFIAGLQTFQQLKSVGDMDQRMRSAVTLMQRDLYANYMLSNGKRVRLSELAYNVPTEGFFEISQVTGTANGAYVPPGGGLPPGPSINLPGTTPPPKLNYLGGNQTVYLFDPAGGAPIPAQTAPTYSGAGANWNPIMLASPPSGVTAGNPYTIQWDVPNGMYDYATGPAVNYPPYTASNPAPPTDADGIRSPFATSIKLHFSIDLSVVPTSSPDYKVNRRENLLAASVPNTIDPTNPASAFSPLLYVNSALVSPATLANSTMPGRRGPFQDSANYLTPHGEVAYFLLPNNASTPSGQQLFSLYRRQLALLLPADANTPPSGMNTLGGANILQNVATATAPIWTNYYFDFSGVPPSPTSPRMRFNTLADVALPQNRCLTYKFFNPTGPYGPGWNNSNLPILGGSSLTAQPPLGGGRGEPSSVWGSDLLLTDVLSFSIRVLPYPIPHPANPVNAANQIAADPFLFPGLGSSYFDGPTTSSTQYFIPGEYDTAFLGYYNGNGVPSIQALEICIRVWDAKTSRTRQITVLQPM